MADEAQEMCGERLRCWDACMFPTYTLEASGHNPRLVKFQRFRNRICHKFSYLITNNHILGCTGCGRCIRECPVGIDLRRIVAHMLGEG
jgi:Fe-S oxidoreductase